MSALMCRLMGGVKTPQDYFHVKNATLVIHGPIIAIKWHFKSSDCSLIVLVGRAIPVKYVYENVGRVK